MSNQQDKILVRSARPQTLASAMGELMNILGVRASDSDLLAHWDEIMGNEIAQIATLVAVRRGRGGKYNIIIRPSCPAFALQLSYQQEEIRQKINNFFGRDAVSKITFRKQ